MFSRKKYLFLLQPWVAAFLSSAAFFAIIFLFFRPGYAVGDDISIISLASGYLGGKPLPFLVYSNVLLGFILNPLYASAPTLNWEILFFIVINFLSVWALVYIFWVELPKAGLKLFAAGTVFLCDTYFLINITYTMMAAFATLAGLCLVLSAVQAPTGLKKSTLIFGCALTLAGSLIRFKSMLLIGGLSLPLFVLFYRPFQFKKLVLAFSLLTLLVSSAYLFDSIYWQASPAWYSYRSYDTVRTQLHDTPRKINVKPAYPQIGWSRNDLKLFFNWFFPDQQIYSLENLQYLVAHVPGRQASKAGTLTTLAKSLIDPLYWPYILLILSTWLLTLFYGLAKRAGPGLIALLTASFAFDFYLAWTLKIPDRISVPLFAGVAIFSIYVLTRVGSDSPELCFQVRRKHKLPSTAWIAAMAVIGAFACGLVINQSIDSSNLHIKKQAAYENILIDMQNLRDNGKIANNALILSPAYGFPLEWANPLSLNLPAIQVLEMGWLTFSPAYEKVLLEFGAQSIPEAFYEKNNIYLMTRPASLSEILDFIKEHKGLGLKPTLIYQIPATDVGLYKLLQNP